MEIFGIGVCAVGIVSALDAESFGTDIYWSFILKLVVCDSASLFVHCLLLLEPDNTVQITGTNPKHNNTIKCHLFLISSEYN